MNAQLDCEPNEEEIQAVLFQMHHTKAPGPDGFHALFFQKFWDIASGDVIGLVKNWWRGNVGLDDINKNCITLIPKCRDRKCMTEFRLINCCNVIYKIISKVLANKLKPFLGDVIFLNQSAFIPKRLITDNSLIAFEIFHSMKHNSSSKNNSFARKLDMSKAYDRVEWDFLELGMLRMGFDRPVVNRVMSCIISVSFLFKLNGMVW